MNENSPRFPRLTRSSIVEALIDLQLKPREPFQVAKLESLHRKISKRYPEKKETRQIQFGFTIGPEASTQQTVGEIVGLRFECPEDQFVLQVSNSNFTLSKLKPYDNWDKLRSEAESLWEMFSDLMQPEAIIRVATRYINRIELPGPNVNFDDYLTAGPKVPSALPQLITEFLTRNVVPCAQQKATLILTQTLDTTGISDNQIPVILDIDVFRHDSFDPKKADHWEIIDSMRELKNLAFFESITEKTLELLT